MAMVRAGAFSLVSLTSFFPSDCSDGDVRLIGGNGEYEGTVEVCFDNLWGLVSESGWTTANAQVVCTQLGYGSSGNSSRYCAYDII